MKTRSSNPRSLLYRGEHGADPAETVEVTADDLSRELRRRHHVVPRFYLERFAKEGRLGILDTRSGEVSDASTKDAAVLRDFYMIYDEEGAPNDVFEVELLDREVESPAAPAVSRTVETGVIADEDWEALARFIGFQSVRGQRFPIPVEDALDVILKMLVTQAAELVDAGYAVPEVTEVLREDLGREPTAEDYAEFVEVGRSVDRYKYKVNRPAMLPTYLEIGEKTGALLLSRRWQLIRFDAQVLVTSDEPVWLEWEGEPGPYGEGFGTVPAVWMALDPAVALRMWRPDLEEIDPSSVEPGWVNRRVVSQAHRFLFGDPDLLAAL